MSNQPVYRYPPRSHAYNCPCPRCAQCRSRPLSSGAWIWVAIPAAAGIWWIAAAPLRIWHVTGADGKQHPDTATWIAYGICGGLILAVLMAVSIHAARKAERARPHARTAAAAEAPEIARVLPPDPPPCLHPRAVRVESGPSPEVTLENWCPDCETSLGVAFRWSCCSAPPGTGPGDGHLYNCPHRKAGSR